MIGYGAANTGFAGLAIVARGPARVRDPEAAALDAAARAVYIGAVLVSTLIVFTLQTITLFVLGALFYDTGLPDRIGSLVLLVVLGAAAFAGHGIRERRR